MNVETDGFMPSVFFDIAGLGGVNVWGGNEVVPTSQSVSEWTRTQCLER